MGMLLVRANFEMAAELRDKMITLKKSLDDMEE